MKVLLGIIFFFSSQVSMANCHCHALLNGVFFFDKEVKNEQECKSKILNHASKQYSHHNQLKNICVESKSIPLKWSCHKDRKKKEKKDKLLACSDLQNYQSAQQLLSASLTSNFLNAPGALDPTVPVVPTDKCYQDEKKNTFLGEQSTKEEHQNNLTSIRISMDDFAEIKSFLEKSLPKKYLPLPGEILDQIRDGSFSITFTNDNFVTDMGTGASSDDIGKTHGMKFEFNKSLIDNGYYLTVSYESMLFTNFENPEDPDFQMDDAGNVHVGQTFIEENVAKVLISKVKKGDAYYWSLGGGFHQINKDETDGSFLLSSLKQQGDAHDVFNRHIGAGSARVYSTVGQEGSDEALFIEGKIGKRSTMFSTADTRAFLEGELQARATGIKDASYVGVKGGAYFDYQYSQDLAIRSGIGAQSHIYINGDSHTEKFAEVVVGDESLRGGIKVHFPVDDVPSYQNATPITVPNRDLYTPDPERYYTLFIEGTW